MIEYLLNKFRESGKSFHILQQVNHGKMRITKKGNIKRNIKKSKK